jgi:hypothetical protein
MTQKSGTSKDAADKLVKGIKRKTRKQYSAEERERANATGSREAANQVSDVSTCGTDLSFS